MSDGTVFRQLSTSEAHQLLQAGTPSDAQAAVNSHALVLVAEVFQAGAFMVEASVDGVKLCNSSPRSLLVLPGSPSADHCIVRGQSKVLIRACKLHPQACYEYKTWPTILHVTRLTQCVTNYCTFVCSLQ